MALNIKNQRVEELATEIAEATGESKTEAIRKALEERKQRLSLSLLRSTKRSGLRRFLEREAWPAIKKRFLGKHVSKAERESILGYGPGGV